MINLVFFLFCLIVSDFFKVFFCFVCKVVTVSLNAFFSVYRLKRESLEFEESFFFALCCIFADGQTHESKMVLIEIKMDSNSVVILRFAFVYSWWCRCWFVCVVSVCAESSPTIVFQQQDGGVG